jgi:hypothetical protein
MVERYNATKSAAVSSLNCTANDVRLAQFNLLSGPPSCIKGEDITVTLLGEFIATSDQRWDIGMFIATDGGNPNSLGGTCYNDYLHVVSADNSDLDLTGGSGPFHNGEISEDPGDTCGDLDQGQNAFFQTGLILAQMVLMANLAAPVSWIQPQKLQQNAPVKMWKFQISGFLSMER